VKGAAATRRCARRGLVLLFLWSVSLALLFGGWAWFSHLRRINLEIARGAGGGFLAIADGWRMAVAAFALLLLQAACFLTLQWLLRVRSAHALGGCFLLAPVLLLIFARAATFGPAGIDSVRLPGGARLILAGEPIPTDSVYTLYQASDALGVVWRQVAALSYSEDGQFTGGARLALSHDGRWLLVGRGGIWTDCFRVVAARRLEDCGIADTSSWNDPSFDRDMRQRSARIVTLTGLQPRVDEQE
jgi:hypothetical protein